MGYDVFISYPHADAEVVRPLAEALRARGLAVWLDATAIGDARSITRAIVEGLACSRMLVAWYSRTYALSRPCQWELTAAYLAAQAEGGEAVGRRIMVVAPDGGIDHIHPIDLRDRRFLEADAAPDDLAGRIAARLDNVSGGFGAIRALDPAPWITADRRTGSNRFVGRAPDLWKVHGGLSASGVAIISGTRPGTDLVQVQGMGGIGKSLLAEEYALRYGAAYPGGIVWLSAARAGADEGDSLGGLMFDLALRFGEEVAGKDPAAVEAMVRRRLAALPPYLWVVDDLPADATAATLRRWTAPTGNGRTLVTTRSTRLDGNGTLVPLGILSPEEAVQLLTSRRPAKTDAERAAAMEIVEALGHHALAVDVAGAAVVYTGFAAFLADLRDPADDAMELARELANELPNGHHPGIAATLLQSVRRLDADGTRFLQLASLLAPEPIPVDFVAAVFGVLAEDLDAGRKQALRGIKAAVGEALAELSDGDAVVVHVLVGRTLRFHDPAPEPMRAGTLGGLNGIMSKAPDIREHDSLRPFVPHVRALTARLDDVPAATLLGWLARMNRERGAYGEAATDYRRQFDARKLLLGDAYPDTLTALSNFAVTLRAQGDLNGARALEEQVLAVRRRVLSDEHSDTLASMNNLANTLRAQGDLSGARALQEQALAVYRRVLGDEHPDTLTSMNNLAVMKWTQGQRREARALLEQALSVILRTQGSGHPVAQAITSLLAQMDAAEGRPPSSPESPS